MTEGPSVGAVVVVGAAGIEPATICSQSRYATAALRPVGVEFSADPLSSGRALRQIAQDRRPPNPPFPQRLEGLIRFRKREERRLGANGDSRRESEEFFG